MNISKFLKGDLVIVDYNQTELSKAFFVTDVQQENGIFFYFDGKKQWFQEDILKSI